MSVNCLVSLLVVSGLASSPSQAAPLVGLSRPEISGSPIQGVVLADQDEREASHGRVLPRTGLIMVGNPPNKLVNSLIMVGNPPGPKAIGKGRSLPKTGLIMVGNPPNKLVNSLIMVGNPPGPKAIGKGKLSPTGKARSVTWVGIDGRELTLPFPAGLDLTDVDALVAPAGEWVDLEIAFSGELNLDGELDGVPFGLTLDVDAWTVALEEPVLSDGTVEIVVDVELPELLVDEVLAADGLVVEPGDDLHDALVGALEDAAVGRAR